MQSSKLFFKALSGNDIKVPPIWLMRQAGRYLPEYREVREKAGGFVELCLNPEFATEVTLQPIRRFGFDASILFSDILMVPYGLGQKLWFATGEGPQLDPLSDWAILKPDHFLERLAPVFETVHRLKKSLPTETALIGFAGGLFTVAAYMLEGHGSRDFATIRLLAYSDPEKLSKLFEILHAATLSYLSAQIKAGAEVIQIFDSWAGLLPEAEFQRWVINPTQKLVKELRRLHPDIPVIGFPRGAGSLYENYARETGVTVLGLDTAVPLQQAQFLQKILPVQGNLDPLLLVAGGAALKQEVKKLCEALSDGPYIFNLGHGIVPQTPIQHVEDLINYIRG